mgnify:CR=1 FL=1
MKALTVSSAGTVNLPSVTTTDGGISVTGTTINLNGSSLKTDTAATAGALSLSGNVVLKSNVTLDTDAATTDADITVSGTVLADAVGNDRTLTLTAGTGTVDLQSAVGGTTGKELKALTVSSAGTVNLYEFGLVHPKPLSGAVFFRQLFTISGSC